MDSPGVAPRGTASLRSSISVNILGTSAWVVGPYLKVIAEYQKTLEKYPNPKPVRLTEFGG